MSGTFPSKEVFARMQALYGENKIITGPYDTDKSAICSNGVFIGDIKEGIRIFKGIPFANPPVGSLRWKPTAAVDDSDQVREALYFGKSPIQQPWYSELGSCYPQSEDCLYLNVWTSDNGMKDKPVMVFIHGGAYGYGGTSDPIYDGFNFVKEQPDLILVTIGYRVGIMGFIDFTEIEGSEGYEDSVNLGIYDQIEALRWIKKNISAFGGNPDNVTVFGESAGGGSVSILPVIEQAKGLFQHVIAQSGSIALTYNRKESLHFTRLLIKQTGKKNMQELLAMSTEELYKANLPINESNSFPVRDGRLIPEDLYTAYKEGRSAGIDMMAGTNQDECRYWIGEMGGILPYAIAIPVLFENQCRLLSKEDTRLARQYYRHGKGAVWWRLTEFENDIAFRVPAQKQLLLHSYNQGKSYHYFWRFPSSLKNRGACHAVELSSVFNNPEEKIYTGDNFDARLAKKVRRMWGNFARTGNPSLENLVWPEYEDTNKSTMVLDSDISIKSNLLSRRTAIIDQLLKYQINGNYGKLDLTVTYVWFLSAMILLIVILLIFLAVNIIH